MVRPTRVWLTLAVAGLFVIPLSATPSGADDDWTLGAANEALWLPLVTPELTSGLVPARRIRISLQRPVFVVGSDNRSLAWLERNAAYLTSIDALGLLVQAASVADLNAVANITGDLEVLPVSGSILATALDLKHYPVLIQGDRLKQ